jgi:hypothetical protein
MALGVNSGKDLPDLPSLSPTPTRLPPVPTPQFLYLLLSVSLSSFLFKRRVAPRLRPASWRSGAALRTVWGSPRAPGAAASGLPWGPQATVTPRQQGQGVKSP